MKINSLATYFNKNTDKEAEEVLDEDRVLCIKTRLYNKRYYIIHIYVHHAAKRAKDYNFFLSRFQKVFSLKREKDLMIILGE
eukprot:snap_masked-scaffold_35-processed-gene-0.6-mRNA-1 protein AED:1.00 eAED:1.00 QI:0/-1/0/0/-1/1/1/0/81